MKGRGLKFGKCYNSIYILRPKTKSKFWYNTSGSVACAPIGTKSVIRPQRGVWIDTFHYQWFRFYKRTLGKFRGGRGSRYRGRRCIEKRENFGRCYNAFSAYNQKQKPNFDITPPVPRLGRQSVPKYVIRPQRGVWIDMFQLSVVYGLLENAE